MSVFTKSLTNKGIALQAKAQAGKELRYTRFVIGDGRLSGQLLPTMTNVISQVKSVPVTKLKMRPPNEAIVGFSLSSQDVAAGFWFRELGLYAVDPDEGEILYLYANAGETADYISPAGSSDVIQKSFDTLAFVGQAQNVTANIDHSLIYVTHPELAEAIAMIDVDIPDASLAVKGKTNLSNATNSTSETEAATPKAVKAAYDRGSSGLTANDAHVKDNAKHVPHLGTTTNTGDAYKITTSEIIGNNQKFTIKFNAASTTAPTLSINGVTADPIKKPNGNNAKLYASVYTLFKDGTAFILQGEGGEYGTSVAGDVRSTKTIGTENGVVQGTLDLSKLIASNIRSGITIDGIIGSLVDNKMAFGTVITYDDYSSRQRTINITGIGFNPKMAILIMDSLNMIISVNGSQIGFPNEFHIQVYDGRSQFGWGARGFDNGFYLLATISNQQIQSGTYKYLLIG